MESTPAERVTVASTAAGSHKTARAIADSAAVLGYESTHTRPPDGLAVGFVDYPFRDPTATFEEHLAVVEDEEPAIAVAPDLDATRDPETVYSQADRLLDHAGAVVVTTKREDTHPEEIPDRFRVGVPLQGDSGGEQSTLGGDLAGDGGFAGRTPWRLADYRDAGEVHLLGGSPNVHQEAARYLDVASVDTSTPERAAKYGDYWTPEGWQNAGQGADLYDTIRASLDYMVAWWDDQRGLSPRVDPEPPRHLTDDATEQEPTLDDPSDALGYGRPNAPSEQDADLWGQDDYLDSAVPGISIEQAADADLVDADRAAEKRAELEQREQEAIESIRQGAAPAATDGGNDMTEDTDTYDPSGEFAAERQGTLAAGVDAEESADDKQVTLTGADEGDDVALPAAWRQSGSKRGATRATKWRAGPYTVDVRGGDTPPFSVMLTGSGNKYTIAEGVEEVDVAAEVGERFTDLVAPDEVTFHSSDSEVMDAAAEAKKAISEANESDGLAAFMGDQDASILTDEEQGRVKAHAEKERLEELLRSADLKQTTVESVMEVYPTVGDFVAAPEFESIDGVGESAGRRLREAQDLAAEAHDPLTDEDDGEDSIGTEPHDILAAAVEEYEPTPSEWRGVSKVDMNATQASLILYVEDGQVSVGWDQIGREWVVDHVQPHSWTRQVEDVEDALDLARKAAGRIADGKPAYEDGPGTENADESLEWFAVHDEGAAAGIRGPFNTEEEAEEAADSLGPYHAESDPDPDETPSASFFESETEREAWTDEMMRDLEGTGLSPFDFENVPGYSEEHYDTIDGFIHDDDADWREDREEEKDLLAKALEAQPSPEDTADDEQAEDYRAFGEGQEPPLPVEEGDMTMDEWREEQAGGDDATEADASPSESEESDSAPSGGSDSDGRKDYPDDLGPWHINDADRVDGGYRYEYLADDANAVAAILPDGNQHKVVTGRQSEDSEGVASGLSFDAALDLLREEGPTLADGATVEFSRLDAANDWRDDHPNALGPSDTRRTKTVTLVVGADQQTVEDAEQAALATFADEREKYGQEKLTDEERKTLERRGGWKWGANGFEAMSAKAALTAEGAQDWLNYYETGEGVSGSLANLEEGKQATAESGAANAIDKSRGESEMTRGDAARMVDKAQGQACSRAVEGCESGYEDACQQLREECGYSDEEIQTLRDGIEEMGEDPEEVLGGSVYDPTEDTDGTGEPSRSFEEWAAEADPGDGPEPTEEELRRLAPRQPTADDYRPEVLEQQGIEMGDGFEFEPLPQAAVRVISQAWRGYRVSRVEATDAIDQAESYATTINGVRMANGLRPLEFNELEGLAEQAHVPQDPTTEYPTGDGKRSLLDAMKQGALSVTGGDVYDPTEDL